MKNLFGLLLSTVLISTIVALGVFYFMFQNQSGKMSDLFQKLDQKIASAEAGIPKTVDSVKQIVSQGSTGAQGETGSRGPRGLTGAAGTNGTNGSNGSNGSSGSNGSNGSDGAAGATGATGATGADGGNTATLNTAYTNSSDQALTFTNSAGLTFNNNSAGKVTFNANGSPGLVIDSTGNVGIGTSTPGLKLEVNGSIQGAVQDKGGQVFNVKSYGAVGDGATNDHDAIVSALTAAGVSGGTVYFPTGTYLTNSQITWPNKSNITMAGAGRNASQIVINFGGSPATGIGIYITSATSLSGVTIKDMTIRGAANDDTAPYDLVQIVDNVSDVMVDNVEFKWARHSGLRVSSGSPGNRETVVNSYFHDINSSAMTGIGGGAILSALSTFKVENTTFENTGNASTFHAIYLSSVTDKVAISNNSFSGTHTRIQFYGGPITNATVSGNTFNNTVNIFWDTAGLAISGNTFYNAGINIGSDNALIAGNTFYATQATNIITNGNTVSNVHIQGNKFVSTTSTPTIVSAITHTTGGDKWIMTDNTFNGGFMKVMTMSVGDSHIFARNIVDVAYTNETVHINGATNVVVNDNRLSGAFGSSVRMETGSGTAQGNVLLGSMTISGMANKNVITDDGSSNVGIGTTTPTGRFHSYRNTAATTTASYTGYFENLATNTTTDAINKYGLYVTSTGSFTGSAGTATNNYGLYINTPTGGDNNFALYSAGGNNYFAGNIGINTTPTYALDILNSATTGMVTAARFSSSNASTKGTQILLGTSTNEYTVIGQNHAGNGTFTNGTYLDTFIANTYNAGNFGNVVLATHGSDRLTVTYDGNVGVGVSTTSGYKTYINGSLAVNSATTDKTGNTSWGTISDSRLKDVQGSYTAGLSQIMQLKPIYFNYKAGNPLHADSSQTYVGFVAQDVQKVIPEAVAMREDGYLRLTSDPIMWAMVNAIQEQQGEIKTQGLGVSDAVTKGANFETRLASLESLFEGSSPLKLLKEVIFEGLVTFQRAVAFLNDVAFGGRLTFADKDFAGRAKILAGDKSVTIVYQKPYQTLPVVSVTPLKNSMNFVVANESVNGFTIELQNAASEDAAFSWISLQVKDAMEFVSQHQESVGMETPQPSSLPSLVGQNLVTDLTATHAATLSSEIASPSAGF